MVAQLSRRKKLALFATLAVLIIGVPSAVWADLTEVNITGTVKDVLGNPVGSARVSDGETSVYTAANGSYTIAEPGGTSFSLTASKSGYQTKTKSAVALPGTVVNFDLPISLIATVSPVYSNSVPFTLTLEATSIAPPDTTVIAETGSSTIQLELVETVSGSSKWRGIYALGSGTVDGSYSFVFRGALGGTLITDSPSRNHVLDRVLPSIGIPAIVPSMSNERLLTSSVFPTVVLPLSDDRSGIDPLGQVFSFTRPDQTSFTVTPSWDGETALYSWASPAEEGTWQWDVMAYDRSGNSRSQTFQFEILPLTPFVNAPPSLAIVGTDVRISAIVPIDVNSVLLRVVGKTATTDLPMTASWDGFEYEGTIPAALVVNGRLDYRIVATTTTGDVVTSPSYRLLGGIDPSGDFPFVAGWAETALPSLPWGSPFGFDEPDEAAPVGPTTFGLDPGLKRIYIADPVNNTVRAYKTDTPGIVDTGFNLTFSDYTAPADIAVVPQTHEVFILDQVTARILRFDSTGQLQGTFNVPGRPQIDHDLIPDLPNCYFNDYTITCDQSAPSSLHAVSSATGGWSLYALGGSQNTAYPIFVDGNYISPSDSIAQGVPGVPLSDQLYLDVSLVNDVPVVGLVDSLTDTNMIVRLPTAPTGWYQDAIEGPFFDQNDGVTGSCYGGLRFYIAVHVHSENGGELQIDRKWQIFGLDVDWSRGACGPYPWADIATVLSADLPMETFSPQNRVFAGGPNGLYQLRTTLTGVSATRWVWGDWLL